MLPQMAETIGLNVSRQVSEAAFFETGRIFRLGPDGRPSEEDHVAIGLFGPVGRTGLDRFRAVDEQEMFLWIKGLGEQAAAALNLRAVKLRPADRPWSAPGRGMEIVNVGAVSMPAAVDRSIRAGLSGGDDICEGLKILAPLHLHCFNG